MVRGFHALAAARFSDDEWERISGYLEDHSGIYVAQEAPTRRFLEAILWMARAGAPWRLLPAELGLGTASTNGSPAGRQRASGKCRWTDWRPTATSSG